MDPVWEKAPIKTRIWIRSEKSLDLAPAFDKKNLDPDPGYEKNSVMDPVILGERDFTEAQSFIMIFKPKMLPEARSGSGFWKKPDPDGSDPNQLSEHTDPDIRTMRKNPSEIFSSKFIDRIQIQVSFRTITECTWTQTNKLYQIIPEIATATIKIKVYVHEMYKSTLCAAVFDSQSNYLNLLFHKYKFVS